MSERYAVVTGSASGIGRAAREALEAAGDRVLGVDLRDAEIECDLSTAAGRNEAMARIREQMGRFVDRIPVPLGRIGTPEEMGAVIAFMVSDVAAYMHGSIVWVDGGMDAALHPDVF